MGWFARLVEDKYRVDELCRMAVVQPPKDLVGWLARAFHQRGIGGALNGLAGVTGRV